MPLSDLNEDDKLMLEDPYYAVSRLIKLDNFK
jgi:hypothetical protein